MLAEGKPTTRAVRRFGDFELDAERGVLLRNGVKVKLQPQPFRVLEYLVARAPAVLTREELGDHIWGASVHVDLDLSLNYCIRQIRLVLDEDAARPRYLETLPRQGYRFIGLVDAVAGTGESTPERAVDEAVLSGDDDRREDGDAGEGERATALAMAAGVGRRGWLVIAGGVLACVLAGLMVWSMHQRRFAQRRIASLAVLPLENYSGDPTQDYFADGLTDELITMLAKNSRLRIPSRTSVMQYKGARRPLREIARELGVDAVLEGSVARSGDQVHLNVQLIQATTDAHLWAESYDRDTRDFISLPREAAQTIARQLQSTVVGAGAARYVSPEAHDAYLRGRYLWFNDKTAKSGEYFRRATELQPDYALGWSGLSIYYGASALVGILSPEDSLAQAESAGRRAVDLDGSLAEAHLALGSALLLHRWDWSAALREIDLANQLDPTFAEAWHFRAKVLATLNRHEEAIVAQRRATELDPFARPWAMALSFLVARRYDEALTEIGRRLESNPTDPILYGVLSKTYSAKGMEAESAQAYSKELELSGEGAAAEEVRHVFATGGREALLRWQLARLRQSASREYVSPVELARVQAELHQPEEALSLLEEALAHRSPLLLWIETEPAFDVLHETARYRAIVRGLGLPDAS